MYSDGYHGPRVEVTILKNGVKHKISQTYLMRVIDVSDKVKHLVKQHPSLMYDYSMSLLSVVTSNGFELTDDRWSVSESRLVKYIPFVPVNNSGEKLWEFTFIVAVTNENLEQPPELKNLSNEETESIYRSIAIGSKECPHLIYAMRLLDDACQEMKEI